MHHANPKPGLPLGVDAQTAEELGRLLHPGEQLRFVFAAETKRNWWRLLLFLLGKGIANTTGEVYVSVTDGAVLITDRDEWVPGQRIVLADLPLPPTFGPVENERWIVLNGTRTFVPGGHEVLERAEAALKAGASPSGTRGEVWFGDGVRIVASDSTTASGHAGRTGVCHGTTTATGSRWSSTEVRSSQVRRCTSTTPSKSVG